MKFRPPALPQDIAALENLLEVKFPIDLRELLSESNGVMDCMQYKQEWMEIGWLLWPVAEIQKQITWFRSNTVYRGYETRFDDFLFFAGAGFDGIVFGYSIASSKVKQDGIYVWYPIRDMANMVVSSLEAFIDEWIGGKLPI